MYGLARCAPDCAYRERLWCIFGRAIIAGCDALLDYLNLAVEASSSAFDEWYIGRQTHLVHVPPCLHIVQRVEHDIETAEPFHVEMRFFDVCMVGLYLDPWIELCRRVFGDKCFWLFYMLVSEEELSIEIAEINRVKIDDMDFAETEEGKVFEKLAADAASTDHQDTGL